MGDSVEGSVGKTMGDVVLEATEVGELVLKTPEGTSDGDFDGDSLKATLGEPD